MTTDNSSLINRTLNGLKRKLENVVDSSRSADNFGLQPGLPEHDRQWLRDQIAQCIRAPSGEVASRTLAARIGQSYLTLNRDGKERFVRLLATEFDVDDHSIQRAINEYQQEPSASRNRKLRHKLQHVLKPARLHLLESLGPA